MSLLGMGSGPMGSTTVRVVFLPPLGPNSDKHHTLACFAHVWMRLL